MDDSSAFNAEQNEGAEVAEVVAREQTISQIMLNNMILIIFTAVSQQQLCFLLDTDKEY